jgi:CRISPR-associated endonuclease Cas1
VRRQATTEPDPLPVSRAGIILAEGFGLKVRVHHGILVVEDDEGQHGRRAQLVRSSARGTRVLLLGRAGYVSVEALRWMAEAGAGFALIDAAAGRVVTSGESGSTRIPALRRAQARAAETETGVEVARYLIGCKIEEQHRVLRTHFPNAEDALATFENCSAGVAKASSISAIVQLEAEAAASYWACFARAPLSFVKRDAPRIPSHWKRFGPRSSPLTGGPRLAASPGHALVNLLNAYAELEARIACALVGLDAGIGIVHVDQPARDSMALDLIETCRPSVEQFALQLIDQRLFCKADFYETTRGVFRVGSELARGLAETLPRWRAVLAPHAEAVARLIGSGSKRPILVPTKATGAARSAGRDTIRKGARRGGEVVHTKMAPACVSCGIVLPDASRSYCDDCLPERRGEVLASFSSSGPATLAKMRRGGEDPMSRPEARKRLGQANVRRRAEAASWDAEHERPDPEIFRREILPGLAEVPLAVLMRATGLSKRYVWLIRRGGYVPHPRHWEALRSFAAAVGARGYPQQDDI